MTARFEGSDNDDAVLEVHQASSLVTFYIYYPGEESVGSRINFNRSTIQKVIDHLENILIELHDE
jgi:hypothetical protein